METIIDRKVYSIDKESVLTRKERNHTSDFIWRGTLLEIDSGVSGREARCHGVDANAAVAIFKRQGERKVLDGSLCPIVRA
jgi:hypothetical protein